MLSNNLKLRIKKFKKCTGRNHENFQGDNNYPEELDYFIKDYIKRNGLTLMQRLVRPYIVKKLNLEFDGFISYYFDYPWELANRLDVFIKKLTCEVTKFQEKSELINLNDQFKELGIIETESRLELSITEIYLEYFDLNIETLEKILKRIERKRKKYHSITQINELGKEYLKKLFVSNLDGASTSEFTQLNILTRMEIKKLLDMGNKLDSQYLLDNQETLITKLKEKSKMRWKILNDHKRIHQEKEAEEIESKELSLGKQKKESYFLPPLSRFLFLFAVVLPLSPLFGFSNLKNYIF